MLRTLKGPWILAPLFAIAFVLWSDVVRLQRVERVSATLARGRSPDAASPTGYRDAKRWLIPPEHDNATLFLIEETQVMRASGAWRLHHVYFDNAPEGRATSTAAPYRWWILTVAGALKAVTGENPGAAIEDAALYADPALHLILLTCSVLAALRLLGKAGAAAVSTGVALLYPLGGAFIPGIASDLLLAQVLASAGAALLAWGTLDDAPRRWFTASGILGGLALWVGAGVQLPVVLGLAAGGLLAAAVSDRATRPLPWRSWAFAGAVTSLLAYLAEYLPGTPEINLRTNYPLYSLAWLGLGECLAAVADKAAGVPSGRALRLRLGASAVAIASVPAALAFQHSWGFLANDLVSSRLAPLPGAPEERSLVAWLSREGLSGAAVATLVPVALLVPLALMAFRGKSSPRDRAALAVAFGGCVAALCLASVRLREWALVDALVAVAAAAALTAAGRSGKPARVAGLAALWAAALCLGVLHLVPPWARAGELRLSRAEVESLYERALSHSLRDHAGTQTPTVLAPPYRTAALGYYGSLSVIGSQSADNDAGLTATFHVAAAMKENEARNVMADRGVTHIVLPSWDADFDDYARMRLKNPDDAFATALRKTDGGIFRWMRPVVFTLPQVPGFGDSSVLVLQVIDETDPATMRSRLVEYLVEMGQLDEAAYASQTLGKYPSDIGSHVALAQLAASRRDRDAFSHEVDAVAMGLSRGSDHSLAWDRRVSLAVVMTLAGRQDLARAQTAQCFREATLERLRFLSPESLSHLLVLGKRFGAAFPSAELAAEAERLVAAQP